jgi:hypothetical protein
MNEMSKQIYLYYYNEREETAEAEHACLLIDTLSK